MRPRLNLQWRVLVVLAGGMGLSLILSAYLHDLVTRPLIEDDRYNAAVAQTVAIAARITALQLLSNSDALLRDIRLVADARRDFEQIDVFAGERGSLRLAATTVPAASRLPTLDETTNDNDLHEMERPVPNVVTMEVLRHGVRYWVISMEIRQPRSAGFVTALVLKNSYSPLVSRLQTRHNLVLAGAIVVCVALVWVLFAHFFQRPARNVVQAMTLARGGNFSSRAEVRRNDELGEIASGFNAMMDDLSARDRERETLLAKISGFNTELREEVDRATSDLRTLNGQLLQSQQRLARAQRLAAVGQVAASLAHEIGTPLNSISGHLHLLARKHPDDDTQRRVVIINAQIESIIRSVRALLLRTHGSRVSLQPTDLNALIGELLRLVGPTLEAHGVSLAVSLDPALPPILADRDGLLQVFLNLINNSSDAMPSGGRVTIETRLDVARGAAEIAVRDSGPGIGPAALEHLFEPMWTTKATGSGFGLAIAREIMDDHGGAIDVEPDVSAGACFRLRVPLADASATV